MDEEETREVTITFPPIHSEPAVMQNDALASSLAHTQRNLAGQLAQRSQRIYQIDVAAFLWWLRAYRAGEAMPGRYRDAAGQAAPSSPADDAARLSQLTRDEVIAYRAYLDAADPADPDGQRRLRESAHLIKRAARLGRPDLVSCVRQERRLTQ